MDPQKSAAEAFSYDWSQHEKSIEIDSKTLNYVDLGDPEKPALLFIHGIVGSWRHWIFNLLPFTDRFRVVAIDLPGFGDSQMPSAPLDMHVYARVTAELCGRLGLRQVTLVGNSMGGLVGAVLAKSSPQLLNRLVLVDAAGFSTSTGWLSRVNFLAPTLNPLMRLIFRFHALVARNRFVAGALLTWCIAHPMKLARQVSGMLLYGSGRDGFVPAARSILATPIDGVPGEISVPTLIVWGRRDYFIPRRDAFKFMRICPNSDVKIVDDAAHLPMLERPDEFNALLEQFLAAGRVVTLAPA
ncbi:MAG: alpha/beta fold hydrolase [Solirubrobacterales bacterium]